jgi:hypothetical protein
VSADVDGSDNVAGDGERFLGEDFALDVDGGADLRDAVHGSSLCVAKRQTTFRPGLPEIARQMSVAIDAGQQYGDPITAS